MSDPPPGPFRPRYANDHHAGPGGERSDRPHLPSFGFMRTLAGGQTGQTVVTAPLPTSPSTQAATAQQTHHHGASGRRRLSDVNSTSSRTHDGQQSRGSASPRYANAAAPHNSRPTMMEARTLAPISSEQGTCEGQARGPNYPQSTETSNFNSGHSSMMEGGPWRGPPGYAGGNASPPPRGPGPSGSSHPSSPNAYRQPQTSARKRGHDESFQGSVTHDSPYQHSIPLSQGSDAGSSRSHHSNPLPSYYPAPHYGAVASAPTHMDSARNFAPRPPQAPGAPGDETQDSMSDQYDPTGSRKAAKINVRVACSNCKKAHLACDTNRPCGRCVRICKTDSCVDVQHKKRGRPRSDRRITIEKSQTPPLPPDPSFNARERDLASPPSTSTAANAPSRPAGTVSAPSGSSASSPAGAAQHEPPFHPNWPRTLQGPPPRRDAEMGTRISQFPSAAARNEAHMGPPVMPVGPHGQPLGLGGMTSMSANYGGGGHRSHMPSLPSPRWRPSDYALMGSAFTAATAAQLSPVLTMICSTALTCARLSENSQALLGYVPTELANRPLVDIVHPEDVTRVRGMWQKLIESVQVRVQPVLSVSPEEIMAIDPNLLIQPALGTSFPEDNVRIRLSNGLFDFYSVRLHIGGYFGADLSVSHSRERAYIVASLLKLGNDGSHPHLHGMVRGGGGSGQTLSPRSNGSGPTISAPTAAMPLRAGGNGRETTTAAPSGGNPRPRSLVPN
ncbi:hypothetical protein OC845_004688 [Tilletia horrida]|nr:hypothetical protein OC845_004688 [Tilletia horrida]